MRFVAALLALLVVAGCGGDPQPKEPKPSPTGSVTPTITPPPMPAQAKKHSPEGAAAFVKHYIDVLNYASSTGDVEELSHLSDPDCSGCQKYIELYRDTYVDGGSFTGGDWSPGEMHLKFGETETYITTTVKIAAGEVKTAPGKPTKPESPSSSTVSFGIAGSPWSTTQFGLGGTK